MEVSYLHSFNFVQNIIHPRLEEISVMLKYTWLDSYMRQYKMPWRVLPEFQFLTVISVPKEASCIIQQDFFSYY
jgi:hypothetical protein